MQERRSRQRERKEREKKKVASTDTIPQLPFCVEISTVSRLFPIYKSHSLWLALPDCTFISKPLLDY